MPQICERSQRELSAAHFVTTRRQIPVQSEQCGRLQPLRCLSTVSFRAAVHTLIVPQTAGSHTLTHTHTHSESQAVRERGREEEEQEEGGDPESE